VVVEAREQGPQRILLPPHVQREDVHESSASVSEADEGCQEKEKETMKVVIGEDVYDARDIPILIVLEDDDKENLQNMTPEATKYCAYPDDVPQDVIKEWMERMRSEIEE
jgi:hypothetical protein